MNDNNFYSIDRLLEFGMGMAVAQQMVNVMNQSMQGMYVPGTMNAVQSNPPLQPVVPSIITPDVFYVAINGTPVGPLQEKELAQLIMKGQVNKDTLAWMPGMSAWQAVQNISAILKIVALLPPPLSQNSQINSQQK